MSLWSLIHIKNYVLNALKCSLTNGFYLEFSLNTKMKEKENENSMGMNMDMNTEYEYVERIAFCSFSFSIKED